MISTLYPDLTADQLAALHRRLGVPACFLLVEVVPGDNGPVAARHEMYPRAWAERGFVRRPPAPTNSAEFIPLSSVELLHAARVWLERYATAKVAVGIALVSQDGVPASAVAELRTDLQTLPSEVATREIVAVQQRDGELFLDAATPLPTLRTVDYSAYFEVQLEGRNTLTERGPHLPLRTGVQFGPSPERHALLRVRGVAPEGSATPLPAEAWFRLELPRAVAHVLSPRLTIDVCPAANPAEDHWNVEWASGHGGRVIPTAPPLAAPGARPPLHLAVVFDRTCPDAKTWPAARRFLMSEARATPATGSSLGISAEQVAGFASEVEPEDRNASLADVQLADCNIELRESVGPALRECLGQLESAFSKVTIHPFWFGDTATADFEPMEGMHRNIETWGAFGPYPATNGQVETLFDSYDYVPSFDVFDPLERVLHEVNERLVPRLREIADGAPSQAAIVIIGNSPPTFAPNGDEREIKALTRFWRVAKTHFCPRSLPGDARSWTRELAVAKNLGIPVIYAFLSLDRSAVPGDGPLKQRVDRVKDLERCTRDALADFAEVRLTDEAPANREGLTAALRQALAITVQSLAGHGHSTLLLTR